jgi:hypothetical protein
VEFLAPCSESLVLLSVNWREIRCCSEELKTSEDHADSQMEVLHIVFPFDKLAGEWKLVCWGLCYLGGVVATRYFKLTSGSLAESVPSY